MERVEDQDAAPVAVLPAWGGSALPPHTEREWSASPATPTSPA